MCCERCGIPQSAHFCTLTVSSYGLMMVAKKPKHVAIVNIEILRSFMYCCVLDGNKIYHHCKTFVRDLPFS